jgi:hypothetical protein
VTAATARGSALVCRRGRRSEPETQPMGLARLRDPARSLFHRRHSAIGSGEVPRPGRAADLSTVSIAEPLFLSINEVHAMKRCRRVVPHAAPSASLTHAADRFLWRSADVRRGRR